MRVTIVLTIFVLLSACATTVPESSSSPSSATWRAGKFNVMFQAGPRQERSFSYYQIVHTSADGRERSLVMESAHSTESFKCVTNGDPVNWIRVVEDSKGGGLLIEEEIPNDCGPCSNYLWVRLDADGDLEGDYLVLPSAPNGVEGGIDYEYPHVRSLRGSVITYAYSMGGPVSKDIGGIEKAVHPTPPG